MFAQAPGQHKVLLILLLMLLNPWQASDSLEVESLALVVEENRYCHRYMGTEITVLETLIWYKKLNPLPPGAFCPKHFSWSFWSFSSWLLAKLALIYLGCWGCLLAVNLLIYLETSSPQQENNIPNLPGILRFMLGKTGKQRCKNPGV